MALVAGHGGTLSYSSVTVNQYTWAFEKLGKTLTPSRPSTLDEMAELIIEGDYTYLDEFGARYDMVIAAQRQQQRKWWHRIVWMLTKCIRWIKHAN